MEVLAGHVVDITIRVVLHLNPLPCARWGHVPSGFSGVAVVPVWDACAGQRHVEVILVVPSRIGRTLQATQIQPAHAVWSAETMRHKARTVLAIGVEPCAWLILKGQWPRHINLLNKLVDALVGSKLQQQHTGSEYTLIHYTTNSAMTRYNSSATLCMRYETQTTTVRHTAQLQYTREGML